MTLEESKEELKQLKEDLHGNGFVYGDFDKVIAMDTVLNYIENESIPKEKVKTLLKNMENEKEIYMRNDDETCFTVVTELDYITKKVEELLEK